MTPEEQKRLKRALFIKFGILIGTKIAIAVMLHRWSKSFAETTPEELDEKLNIFVSPYATVRPGENLRLLCTKEHEFGSPQNADGWGCRWGELGNR